MAALTGAVLTSLLTGGSAVADDEPVMRGFELIYGSKTIQPGQTDYVVVDCPAGKQAIAGNYEFVGSTQPVKAQVIRSAITTSGWTPKTWRHFLLVENEGGASFQAVANVSCAITQ
ncbi:hypothetical protein [Streptosporangium fragile]